MVIGFIIGEMGYSGNTITVYCVSLRCRARPLLLYVAKHPTESKGSVFTLRDLLCLDALALFKDRSFSVLMLSIFVLMIPKTAYSAYIPVF